MSAGDRGGVSELVAVIKSSKVPIIAIANDKWSQKLKPLRSAALELDFRKPDARTVAKRLAAVCAAEGLQVRVVQVCVWLGLSCARGTTGVGCAACTERTRVVNRPSLPHSDES